MELLIASFIFLFLTPILFGWLLISVTPFLMALIAGLYLWAASNRYTLKPRSQERDNRDDIVLVVDDEYQSVIPLLKLLEQARVPFRYVADGLDAIKELRQGQFRLVFMDIAMPNLSGVEALTKADQLIDSGKSPTPVIFYSGTDVEDQLDHPLKHLSVIDTWNKSMNLFRLHNRLNNLLASN